MFKKNLSIKSAFYHIPNEIFSQHLSLSINSSFYKTLKLVHPVFKLANPLTRLSAKPSLNEFNSPPSIENMVENFIKIHLIPPKMILY